MADARLTGSAATADPGAIAGGVRQALAHDSAVKHVSGAAAYVDDIPELPGTVQVLVGMSERAHARIAALDLDAVRAAPGIVAVLSAADIPGVNDASPVAGDDPVFAESIVEYAGQSIFAIVAETMAEARAALKLAQVTYDDELAILTVGDALEADADLLPSHTMTLGDTDAALAAAGHRIAGQITVGGQDHFYLEGQVAYAVPGEDRDMIVHSGFAEEVGKRVVLTGGVVVAFDLVPSPQALVPP